LPNVILRSAFATKNLKRHGAFFVASDSLNAISDPSSLGNARQDDDLLFGSLVCRRVRLLDVLVDGVRRRLTLQ